MVAKYYDNKDCNTPRVQADTSSRSHPQEKVEEVPPPVRACSSDSSEVSCWDAQISSIFQWHNVYATFYKNSSSDSISVENEQDWVGLGLPRLH
jgi:hypothetical protein